MFIEGYQNIEHFNIAVEFKEGERAEDYFLISLII
jgi:hypothetical protein